VPWPGYLPPPPRESFGVLRDLPVVAAIVLLVAMLGVPAGLLWHQVSAKPAVLESANGDFELLANVDKNYFGTDAAFLGITAFAGLATGAVAWAATRRRGPAVPVGIAAAGLVGSVVARAVGERPVINATLDRACGVEAGYDAICAVYDGHLRVRSLSVLVGWALTAVAVHLVLTAVVDRRQQQHLPPPSAPWAGWYNPGPPGSNGAG
jgi:hypothetical protein